MRGSVATIDWHPQNILDWPSRWALDFWGYTLVAWYPRYGAGGVYALSGGSGETFGSHLSCRGSNRVERGEPGSYPYKPCWRRLGLVVLFSLPFPRNSAALIIAVLVMLIAQPWKATVNVEKVDWKFTPVFVGLFLVTGAAAAVPEVSRCARFDCPMVSACRKGLHWGGV